MTTYSKVTTEHGRRHTTVLHLVYRIEGGELKTLGLFETRADAEEDLALMSDVWKVADVLCLGWGIVDDVVERNSEVAS
jgi:hypothetical protein